MSNSKRTRGTNQLANLIVDISTSDAVQTDSGKNPAAVALGRLGGKKGGVARAKKLSPERRSEIARKAAKARYAKKSET